MHKEAKERKKNIYTTESVDRQFSEMSLSLELTVVNPSALGNDIIDER